MSRQLQVNTTILAGLLLTGCAHQTGADRSNAIQKQVAVAGWHSQVIRTSMYDLQAFSNGKFASDSLLNVHIEGDGYAWVDGQFPSDDPTPVTPLGLELAMAQPVGAVAYIGRPCQYLGADSDRRCHKQVWTNARFSDAVVQATSSALDQLKSQSRAHQLQLIGYSGGAAVALLVAAQRMDVSRIIAVAGNLDPVTWAEMMKVQPLNGSRDTRLVVEATSRIPQIYLVGGKDRVVPAALTENFAKMYPLGKRPRIIDLPENNHACCWVDQWPTLWNQELAQ